MIEVDVLAAEVLRLQDSAVLAEPFSATLSGFSVSDAYSIAKRLREMRIEQGLHPVGRKIGFTNRTIYEEYGVYQPIFGTMYDRTVTWLDMANEMHEVPLAGLAQPRIEPEIVFKLKAAPPRTDDPVELLGAIEWLAHGVELVQCHFPGWKFQVADTIADGGLHGRYLVGKPLPVPKGEAERRALAEALSSFTARLYREGKLAADGGGVAVLGSPLNALAHLIDVLAELPDHPPLAAGEIVTTGTLTAAMPVTPGETWSTSIEGLEVAELWLRFV
jgi:2-oxo-3-hexenedioate decarboxylase